MKCVAVVEMSCKFHLHLTCNSRVFIFQMFSHQQKVQFQAVSGWFFGRNAPKCSRNGLEFSPVMQCKVMRQIFDSFYSIIQKWSKLGQNDLRPNLLPNETSYRGTYSWQVSLVWNLLLSSYEFSHVFVVMHHP